MYHETSGLNYGIAKLCTFAKALLVVFLTRSSLKSAVQTRWNKFTWCFDPLSLPHGSYMRHGNQFRLFSPLYLIPSRFCNLLPDSPLFFLMKIILGNCLDLRWIFSCVKSSLSSLAFGFKVLIPNRGFLFPLILFIQTYRVRSQSELLKRLIEIIFSKQYNLLFYFQIRNSKNIQH